MRRCASSLRTAPRQVFNSTNAVEGDHGAAVTYTQHIESAAACQQLAARTNATVFTWHDPTCGHYANVCATRFDGVWDPQPQAGHTAGYLGAQPPPGPTPVPQPACSLNGVPVGGGTACRCDPGWGGAACEALRLLPAPAAATVFVPTATPAWSTWGATVLQVDGAWHMWQTEIANNCSLHAYGTASQIVHRTSTGGPLGPWVRRGVALAAFAHNPQAVQLPSGHIALFHIGAAFAEADCVLNCTAGASPRPSHCPTPSHGSSVAVAATPEGPWTRYPYAVSAEDTNPAPVVAPDGSLAVAVRRSRGGTQTWYLASRVEGPYRAVSRPVVGTASGNTGTFEEDPYVWVNARGEWHMLTHRELPGGSSDPNAPMCGGGHLFSPDGVSWWEGAPVYNCSVRRAMPGSNGSTAALLTARQRPTLLQAGAWGQYLFNGAAGPGGTQWTHSYTMVQELQG